MQTTTTQPDKRGPGRPRKEDRDEERRRRRKASGADIIGNKLGVSARVLDFNAFAYRWINDDPGRLLAMTKDDDWDIVSQDGETVKEDSADLGSAVTYVVGAHRDGKPKLAYLCCKPKKYFEEDREEKQKELDDQLSQLRRGMARDGSSQSDYVQNSAISDQVGAR